MRHRTRLCYAGYCGLCALATARLSAADPVNWTNGYMTDPERVAQELDSLHLHYPNLVSTKYSIGQSWENRDIWAVRISNDPTMAHPERPAAHFDASHHGREATGPLVLFYFAWHLLEGYGTDPEATYLLDHRELYLIPGVNPDGIARIVPSNWGIASRLNAHGVNLNRNYPVGYAGPGGEAGSGPFSEPETQAIRAHILAHANLRTAVTHHDDSPAGHWLWGFSNQYTYTRPANYALLAEYGDVIRPLTAGFGVLPPMTTGMGANIYGIVPGVTMDWLNDIGITAFWTELGYRDGRNLADIARANLRPQLMVTWWAGAYAAPTALAPVDGTLNAGADEALMATIRNTGLGASESLILRVTTSDPYVTIVDGLATAMSVAARSSATNGEDGLWIRIAPDCPHDHVCPLNLEVDQGGVRRSLLVTLTVNAERDRLISMSIIPGYEWDADQASGAVTDPPSGGIQNIHLRHNQEARLTPVPATSQ